MTFIKKIFTNNIDEEVHKSFTRFSRGIFENRALMKIQKSKDSFKLYVSYDLVKDIILLIADYIQKADVAGKIIKSKKKTEINSSLSSEELKKICDENDFVLLDITASGITFKCKKAIPKPGKSLDGKFASAALPIALLDKMIFGFDSNFKQAVISHTFDIKEIVIPDEYKNNPELARIKARRKGTIKRIIDIDGKHEEKNIEFTA